MNVLVSLSLRSKTTISTIRAFGASTYLACLFSIVLICVFLQGNRCELFDLIYLVVGLEENANFSRSKH